MNSIHLSCHDLLWCVFWTKYHRRMVYLVYVWVVPSLSFRSEERHNFIWSRDYNNWGQVRLWCAKKCLTILFCTYSYIHGCVQCNCQKNIYTSSSSGLFKWCCHPTSTKHMLILTTFCFHLPLKQNAVGYVYK